MARKDKTAEPVGSRPLPSGKSADGKANPIDRHVGERLRLRREILGLSQARLAEAIGLTFQQVQKYEVGANRIGISRLYEMACALSVPVSFFYEDMPPQVAASSPVRVIARGMESDGEAYRAEPLGPSSLPPGPDGPAESRRPAGRDRLMLAMAFQRIPDAELRALILAAMRRLAAVAAPGSSEEPR